MLYIKLKTDNDGNDDGGGTVLQYACKKCGNAVTSTDPCVVDTNYMDDQTAYKQYATKYITYDPTLPRVNNIPCPNPKCVKPANVKDEVIYVKYDFVNLKFLYHCTHCNAFWKSGGAADADADTDAAASASASAIASANVNDNANDMAKGR